MKRVFYPVDLFKSIAEEESGNEEIMSKHMAMKKALYYVINNDLTKTQKSYIILYYKHGMKICEIAEQYGVNRSTVSRTISRAKNKIFNILKYYTFN